GAQQKGGLRKKPFFVSFAPGATHAPHHVPKEWADRYAGQFDDGWDVQRERTFARQKQPGGIPAHAHHAAPPGQFDDGWAVQGGRTFARKKDLGVIPADAELTVRHAELPAWDDMPAELEPVFARQMEVYAGFLAHVD